MERGIGIHCLVAKWTMDGFCVHLDICPFFVHMDTLSIAVFVHGQLSMDKSAMDSAMDNCPWTKMQWTVQWTIVHGQNGQWTMDMDKKHAMDAQLWVRANAFN